MLLMMFFCLILILLCWLQFCRVKICKEMTAILMIFLLGAGTVLAKDAQAIYAFNTAAQAARFNSTLKLYRCLVCQNESLADSDAALAEDLRQVIYQSILQNKTDQQITTFLVSRYGQFVRLKPTLTKHTYLLWFFPWFVLLLIVIFCARIVKRKELSL